jgi:hypothetical protein
MIVLITSNHVVQQDPANAEYALPREDAVTLRPRNKAARFTESLTEAALRRTQGHRGISFGIPARAVY